LESGRREGGGRERRDLASKGGGGKPAAARAGYTGSKVVATGSGGVLAVEAAGKGARIREVEEGVG
jgi:hypothetical protein